MTEPAETPPPTFTPPEPAPLAYFDPGDGRRIAYRLRPADPAVNGPAILFLPGYASDMEGAKATALDQFAAAAGLAYLRLDYSGTGSSGGDFADGTLDRWLGEVLAAVDQLVAGPVVVVGSSMGGWLALHVALARPDRVKAVVGVAAAPDFTDWGYTAEDKERLQRDGRLERANPYGPEPSITHRAFWESGAAMRLLYKPIVLECPVRLIHGDQDEEVPVGVAFKLLQDLHSGDVQLEVIKWGKHRLSEPHELEAIVRGTALLCAKVQR